MRCLVFLVALSAAMQVVHGQVRKSLFEEKCPGKKPPIVNGTTPMTVKAESKGECVVMCQQRETCNTVTYSGNTCLLQSTYDDVPCAERSGSAEQHLEKVSNNWCAHGGHMDTENGTCSCEVGYSGRFCHIVDGAVILRRVDASVDFKRNLADYVAGFGDPAGNYWHGLERIHALTSAAPMELMVTMETFEGESAYASYSSFSVGDAASGYQLAISGYSGTAGDSMDFHNGMKFSTVDNDVDLADYNNCANSWHGGWWYKYCHRANPTGLYLNGAGSAYSEGINWKTYKGFNYSLKRIEFKITPIE